MQGSAALMAEACHHAYTSIVLVECSHRAASPFARPVTRSWSRQTVLGLQTPSSELVSHWAPSHWGPSLGSPAMHAEGSAT